MGVVSYLLLLISSVSFYSSPYVFLFRVFSTVFPVNNDHLVFPCWAEDNSEWIIDFIQFKKNSFFFTSTRLPFCLKIGYCMRTKRSFGRSYGQCYFFESVYIDALEFLTYIITIIILLYCVIFILCKFSCKYSRQLFSIR